MNVYSIPKEKHKSCQTSCNKDSLSHRKRVWSWQYEKSVFVKCSILLSNTYPSEISTLTSSKKVLTRLNIYTVIVNDQNSEIFKFYS